MSTVALSNWTGEKLLTLIALVIAATTLGVFFLGLNLGAVALAAGIAWGVWAGFSDGASASISHRAGAILKWPLLLLSGL